MSHSDGFYWIATIGLVAVTLVALHIAWRTWRDPDNWRLDPERGRVAFNHWKELALALGTCAALVVLLVYWFI